MVFVGLFLNNYGLDQANCLAGGKGRGDHLLTTQNRYVENHGAYIYGKPCGMGATVVRGIVCESEKASWMQS